MLDGCAPKRLSLPVSPETPDQCSLRANSSESVDTLTVALLESVSMAHAPTPTNDSERLLFRHLYDTVVRLDCQGHVRPGLAVAWKKDSAGRIWTFTLSDGARLPGGSMMKPDDIVSAWQRHPGGLDSIGIESTVAVDDRRLAVTLSSPRDSVPEFLADPALAVAIDSPPGLDFQMLPNGDPRDALDRGADLVVTRDPAAVEYSANRPELTSFPLPWSRTYVLLQPAGAETVAPMIGSDSIHRSLAQDAVRAEARAAEPPFWWNGPAACTVDLSTEVPRPTSSRVVYSLGDAVARALAERIVALASGGVQLSAAGLEAAEFDAALRSGSERGYILALPRRSLAPCRDSAALPHGASIRPLIDARADAIVRRGTRELTVEWDGTVRAPDYRMTQAARP